MGNIMRHSIGQNMKKALKCCDMNGFLNIENKKTKFQFCCNSNFSKEIKPEHFNLLKKESIINNAVKFYKNNLLNELSHECGFDGPLPFFRNIVTRDINILKKMGFCPGIDSIIQKMISCLEPFPFKHEEIFTSSKAEFGRIITISTLRNFVEKQYLAWKFKVGMECINLVLTNYYPCLFVGRSLRSIRRNLDIIEKIPEVHKLGVNSKIYLINLVPFKLNTLFNFQNNILGCKLYDAVQLYPELLKLPYQCIMIQLQALQSQGFNDHQIRNALPFLKVNLLHLLKKLNYLLNSKLSDFQHKDNFLELLFFNTEELSNLVDSQHKSFSELLDLAHNAKIKRNLLKKRLNYCLIKMFGSSEYYRETLQNHLKFSTASEAQVRDTLKLLREKKFTKKEISESITIILYPRQSILNALKKVEEEKHNLSKIGFINGYVPQETPFFTKGTKLRCKTLQLCLYYLEHFQRGF